MQLSQVGKVVLASLYFRVFKVNGLEINEFHGLY